MTNIFEIIILSNNNRCIYFEDFQKNPANVYHINKMKEIMNVIKAVKGFSENLMSNNILYNFNTNLFKCTYFEA